MAQDSKAAAAIATLQAKQAITEALYRYCRGEDRLDRSYTESAWHPDGTATYGFDGEGFQGAISGYAAAKHPELARWTGTSHQVANILIEFNGNRAVSEAYVTATLWGEKDDGHPWVRVALGRYLDRWSCRDEIWAIDHRRYIFDFAYSPVLAAPSQGRNLAWRGTQQWFEGRRGPSDPVYQHLVSLGRDGD
jgi:hypothetical protein